MNLKFQYNKIAQLQLEKQLKIRQKALPTLKNKESALRMEVKRARDSALELDGKIKSRINELEPIMKLWAEFDPSLIKVENVEFLARKIAGVPVPILGNIQFEISEYDLFSTPSWYLDGIEMIKEIAAMRIEREFFWRKMLILEQVRKKTTQKVNLYEKVQIPIYEDAIRKIKRFLEDEENLSKASQKILKTRISQEAAV
ncbi:MAG: V-type ATP synthase subunit D [Candidatus Cloacimonetes bacterium]|jgi:V/A-type H+-transporting ATPase subunit D|uniref:V-type ATP synthase subunit D n=1 Tax=Candidatus Syntrophosphaera thermopropionivorans TaxID=2593015 RepID=A0AC61QIM0_9BACT|nr:V-type ATP synthase subunit D [Candidatus Syntrophosphaera thermopropionivorans]MBP7899078.1 V-type ATP synthase subunit D [Candidatus Syntrophosphaera sp.]NLA44477.1 V-type ATP synthase subunit D [Candidatus Cloacimonadota bacterium]MBP7932626.1 V-type ATP synthase subunit D [Candidatus Syntrophosphaera sp.]MBP9006897.1 V-type ATP synthase subunit D [Candidatus Syntrophosphaera sp.]TDF72777.1 V-type ATP synthase subunit D [Candidatus Syntrophosphaera thermopropionivorans]